MASLSVLLTRHLLPEGPRWAADGAVLPLVTTLSNLLSLPQEVRARFLQRTEEPVSGPLLAPIDQSQEVWASGVTYRRSLVEREAESSVADVYAKIYEAERPELFFKAVGTRVVGYDGSIRIRKDSVWNVPEPELTLVVDSRGAIVGYTAGNDVSSRSIEGENPLYLPQAKCYDGACALGPGIVLDPDPGEVSIAIKILRGSDVAFSGEANTSQMKRTYADLVEHLTREMTFSDGAFLMTGTGIVPERDFTLQSGDQVEIQVGELILRNDVA